MSIIASFSHVEIQEVGGESFSKVAEGKLDIVSSSKDRDVPAVLKVSGYEVPFIKGLPNGPYRKLDSKTFIFSTPDLMSFYYVVFSKETSADDLETANYVFEQLSHGKDPTPVPKAAPAPAAAAAAAENSSSAPAPAGSAAKPQANNPLGQLGGMLQGFAQRAQKDSQLLGEIAQKAAADTMLVAAHGAKAVQDALANNGGKPATGGAP